MSKLIVLFLFQLTFFYSYSQNRSDSSNIKKNDSVSIYKCTMLLSQGRKYWINDSLGKAGYRYLLAFEFLRKCPFVNTKWDEVSYYFGEPGSVYEDGKMTRYRYALSQDYFLSIVVRDGIISEFEVRLFH